MSVFTPEVWIEVTKELRASGAGRSMKPSPKRSGGVKQWVAWQLAWVACRFEGWASRLDEWSFRLECPEGKVEPPESTLRRPGVSATALTADDYHEVWTVILTDRTLNHVFEGHTGE